MEKIEDVSIIDPEGEIDDHEGKRIMHQISRLMRYDLSKIVLDLSKVQHIDFRVLNELGAAAAVSSFKDGGIKLANLNAYNKEILKMVGVDRYLETYDTVAEAILSFQNPLTKTCLMQ